MQLRVRFTFFIFAILLGFALSGCVPDQNSSDEEKEPHFVLGQSRINAMDYQGAVEAFEESLEVNPHSAQAHYQLAMLFDTQISDPASAIYHYRQYLKFEPNASNASIIRQRIEACKQQLASDVLALPSSSATQQQLERLIEQNRELQDEVDKWRAWYANGQAAKTNSPPQNQNINPWPRLAQNNFSQTQNSTPQPKNPVPQISSTRTHTVAAGETAAAISRKSGIKISALQSVNPGVNLSKLRIGQVLNFPTQP